MASARERILARLLIIALETPGVSAAARNANDVPGLARPAILIHDGTDARVSAPGSERLSRRQTMILTPEIHMLAQAAEPDVGTLLNQCCERFIAALTQDPDLLLAIGIDPASQTGSGEIRYDGCVLEPASAESKERRLLVNFVFTYPYRTAGT